MGEVTEIERQREAELLARERAERQRLFWFRRMENLSKVIVSADNLTELLPDGPSQSPEGVGGEAASSGALLSRNVSVPFLLRQLGGAKAPSLTKARRIPTVDNLQREILE